MIERSVKSKVGDYEVTQEFIPARQQTVFKTRKILEPSNNKFAMSPIRDIKQSVGT